MPSKKLKQAPLKEAIFELFWKLPLDATNFPFDPEFDMALGKFQNQISDRYPVSKRLFPPGSNVRIYPKPGYQFWRGELEWPVVQVGPGVLTVNETEKNYIWADNFRPAIVHALEALEKSYSTELEFNKVRLTYIDAVDFDPEVINPSEFVARNLLTQICTDYDPPGKENNINISQSFTIGNETLFNIQIQNGLNNATNSQAIVWTTAVETSAMLKKEELLHWLDTAHKLASDFFVKMLNPDFYASFDR
jgi:uncharacterized protein (TIGR04255 family)